MFLALRAGEIDQRIVLEETEAEKILSGTFVQPAVGTANLTRWLPTCLSMSPCRFIPYNASMQSGLSSRWLLLCKNFLRGLRFLVAGPNFFFLESVSHFGIMHACNCNDDWSSTTVDNKKNASACLCWKSNKQMRSKPQAQVDKGPIIYLVGSAWVVEYELVSWC